MAPSDQTTTNKSAHHGRGGGRYSLLVVPALLLLAGCSNDGVTAATDAHSGMDMPTSAMTADAPAASGRSESSEADVTISDTAFTPAAPTMRVGAEVTVVNSGQLEHTFTSDAAGVDSGTIPPGGTFTFVIERSGEFTFHCDIHPTMTGTITVE